MADQQWEYETLDVPNAPNPGDYQAMREQLAEMGDQGWELVAVRNATASGPEAYQMFFKRPKAREQRAGGSGGYVPSEEREPREGWRPT